MRKRLIRKRRARDYYAVARYDSCRQLYNAVIVLLAGVLVLCAVKIISYARDSIISKQGVAELSEINKIAKKDEQTIPTVSPVVEITAEAVEVTPEAQETPRPTAAKPQTAVLPPVRYPTNYYASVSSRFRKLQEQNKDIIAWINIPNVLDQAVVQRDNSYYLRRDYRGYHNQNGALFLDKDCKLNTRPYTYIVYGHNMKTGAMFGFLRNYENSTFYHNNPFITFDTAYENGKYVVVAVGTVSTVVGNRKYVSLAKLLSSSVVWRKESIEQLSNLSVYHTMIDVQPDDQLLLLLTCVDDSTERRVVMARRIRADESEESLITLVSRTLLK